MVAGGGKIPILGHATFNLRIGELSLKCRANVIEKLPYPLLLGMEFLRKNKAVMNLRVGTKTFTIPLNQFIEKD